MKPAKRDEAEEVLAEILRKQAERPSLLKWDEAERTASKEETAWRSSAL